MLLINTVQLCLKIVKQSRRHIQRAEAAQHAASQTSPEGVQLNPLRSDDDVESQRSFSRSLSTAALAVDTSFAQKANRIGSLQALQQAAVEIVILARIFRAMFLNFNNIYALHPASDDDAVYRPFFFTMFALTTLEMLSATLLVAWEKADGNVIDAHYSDVYQVFLEALETSVSLTGIVYFTRSLNEKTETQLSRSIAISFGCLVAFLGLLSDLKGQLFSKPYGHSHRLKFSIESTNPEDQKMPWAERAYNATLRVSHIFTVAMVLQYSLMDVFITEPFVIFWLENEKNVALLAAPFAIAYTITSILTASYSDKTLIKIDAALQALTVACLSFVGTFLFSIEAQLWFDNEYYSGYILHDPFRFWVTAMLPAILFTTIAVGKTLQDHQNNVEAKALAQRGTDFELASIYAAQDTRPTLTDPKAPPSSSFLETLTGRRKALPLVSVTTGANLRDSFSYHAALTHET